MRSIPLPFSNAEIHASIFSCTSRLLRQSGSISRSAPIAACTFAPLPSISTSTGTTRASFNVTSAHAADQRTKTERSFNTCARASATRRSPICPNDCAAELRTCTPGWRNKRIKASTPRLSLRKPKARAIDSINSSPDRPCKCISRSTSETSRSTALVSRN